MLSVVRFLCYLRHCVTLQGCATGLSMAPEKKGVGSETKKKWLYVRHLPIGLFGQINKKMWGTIQHVSGKWNVSDF